MIGRVYEIVNDDGSIRYVGSTSRTLDERWKAFKDAYNRHTTKGIGTRFSIYDAFDVYGMEAFQMNLLFNASLRDREHLLQYEQHFIESLRCVNKNRAYRSPEVIREIKRIEARKFNARHREMLRAKANRRVICDQCGVEYNYSGTTCHRRTQRHINSIQN
jgi:hypothetical protein